MFLSNECKYSEVIYLIITCFKQTNMHVSYTLIDYTLMLNLRK